MFFSLFCQPVVSPPAPLQHRAAAPLVRSRELENPVPLFDNHCGFILGCFRQKTTIGNKFNLVYEFSSTDRAEYLGEVNELFKVIMNDSGLLSPP